MRRVAFILGLAALGCGAAKSAPGVTGVPAPPKVLLGELDARLLLRDLPARAAELGASGVSLIASAELVEGERIGGFIEVPRGMCLLAYARASSSIDDIDVGAFGDEGDPVAADDAPDAHPTILLCPPHPDRVYVAAHAASGEGLVALAAQLVPPARAEAVARAVGARGLLGPGTRPADAWPGLDDRVRAHRTALGGRWEEFRKVAVGVDARAPSFVNFPVEADQCTDAVVVPDEDVGLVEIEALDDAGRVVARAREGPRERAVTVCSPVVVNGSLSIRPHVGHGLVEVVLGRAHGEVSRDLTTRADIAWAAPIQPLDATRAERNAELAKAGYAGPASSSGGALAVGRRVSLPLEIPAATGTCLRIDVVGGAPAALLEASAWDETAALLSKGEGASSVTLFACGRGKAHVDIEARGRAGPYATLVRPERWQSPVFSQHPLAAARMLARAAVGPAYVLEGNAAAVRAVTVAEARG